jgi:hypothetical protein
MVEAWDSASILNSMTISDVCHLMENIHRLMRFEAEWLGRVSRLLFCFERQIQEALSILLVKAISGSACESLVQLPCAWTRSLSSKGLQF